MALVHRSDDPVGPVRRASDNLNEVLRAERLRNDLILRYRCGNVNGHKPIDVEEATCSDEIIED